MHSFESALDLFSGSSSVSYLLKAMGKKEVISNDYMSPFLQYIKSYNFK